VAVLVHGGGWVAGLPASMEPLGRALADRGMVVFNASYRTLMAGGGYPDTFDDIACAVRYARSEASRLGASKDVTLVGHSAGAHIAAVVALTDDTFGGDCPWEGSSVPERWVGLAGIYRLSAVEPVMEALLGGDRQTVPDAWAAADPFEHLAAAADVDMVVVHGIDDEIVPASSSREFALALRDGGVEVTLEVLEGTNHMDMLDPDVTAALIAP
jgi:acetyl esterase/lipase